MHLLLTVLAAGNPDSRHQQTPSFLIDSRYIHCPWITKEKRPYKIQEVSFIRIAILFISFILTSSPGFQFLVLLPWGLLSKQKFGVETYIRITTLGSFCLPFKNCDAVNLMYISKSLTEKWVKWIWEHSIIVTLQFFLQWKHIPKDKNSVFLREKHPEECHSKFSSHSENN